MRIILTCNFSPWSKYSGGGQRSVHNIATSLAHIGYDVFVIYSKSPFEKIRITDLVNYNIEWALIPTLISRRKAIFRNLSAYSFNKVVKKLITEETILHSNGEESALFYRLRKKNKFVFILTPRYPSYPVLPLETKERRLNLIHLLFKSKYQVLAHSIRDADIIAPTSQYTARLLKKKFSIREEKIEVIPNGIINEAFNAPKRDPKPGSIFFFGRLEKSKGIDVLLKAFAQLPSDTTLIVSGFGDFIDGFNQLKRELKISNRLTYIPWMSPVEITEQLSQSSIVCLPSLEESFGNAIAEALASGAPVISARAGSIPELIRHKHNGVLIEPKHVDQLYEYRLYLLSNAQKAEHLGVEAKKWSLDYKLEKIALLWVTLYEKALNSQS